LGGSDVSPCNHVFRIDVFDLPFLEEQAKRNILGANAARLFGLDTKPVNMSP